MSTRCRAPAACPCLPLSLCCRQLLDWSCTSTTLTLMDWFKLSDIGTSLYFVQWTVQMRSQKRRGERQPRWLKLCQGMLIFTGLLLLLWVPLLLFSSAAPTYIVPAVQSHGVNATLRAASGGTCADFPLFAGGGRRQQQQFLPGASSLPEELATYAAEQFQLLCVAEVSEVELQVCWGTHVSPWRQIPHQATSMRHPGAAAGRRRFLGGDAASAAAAAACPAQRGGRRSGHQPQVHALQA